MGLLKTAFATLEILELASVPDVAEVVLRGAQGGREQVNVSGLLALGDEYMGDNGPAHVVPRRDQARIIVAEAIGFLVSQNFLAVVGSTANGLEYQLTRLGKRMKSRTDFSSYAKAELLPPQLLHPRLVTNVRPLFLSGQYDAAELTAFKEVEVAVRELKPYTSTDLGVALMREALGKAGPLASTFTVDTERDAFGHLFAGAIGYFKNPQSHRTVGLDDANVAALRILLASELLTLLDYHRRLAAAPPPAAANP